MKWNKGDWCLYEYKLALITEMNDGRVTEIKDGTFCTGGYDLSSCCRPLSLRNVAISDLADYWSNRLHKEGHNGLNYPDIHRKLVDLWRDACDAARPEEEATTERIGAFAEAVLKAVNDAPQVDGVSLLRRRA